VGDEPARLLTHVFVAGRPIREILTADYGVDEAFAPVARPAEHGSTGVLTMPGYIRGKPGLPHFNYAARVLSGFLGFVFQVPPEVFDERATATAASTVDPESPCYSCHKLLTPLAHQRLRWDDDGNYRAVDDDGLPIDDSDRNLVSGYPYAGAGLDAFAVQASVKEGYIRRMSNLLFAPSFNRNLRHDGDERLLYQQLWNAAASGNGTFGDMIRVVLFDPSYTHPTGSNLGATP
jgi:hypothetical protein